jgi:hypothetical protein
MKVSAVLALLYREKLPRREMTSSAKFNFQAAAVNSAAVSWRWHFPARLGVQTSRTLPDRVKAAGSFMGVCNIWRRG